ALEARLYLNRSEIALSECGPYHYDARGYPVHPHDVRADDPTGAKVNHGDRVIADALAWKMMRALGGPARPEAAREEAPHPGSLAGRRVLWEHERRQDAWVCARDCEMKRVW